jgi:hypothetical protein
MVSRTNPGVVALVALVALASCTSDDASSSGSGSGATEGVLSSCDLSADGGYCLDFAADAEKGVAQANCDNAKSTVGFNGVAAIGKACPTAGRVGTCVATVSGVTTTYRYYGPKFTTDKAQTNCKGIPGGTGAFTPN